LRLDKKLFILPVCFKNLFLRRYAYMLCNISLNTSVVVLDLGSWPWTVLKDTSEVLGLGLKVESLALALKPESLALALNVGSLTLALALKPESLALALKVESLLALILNILY